MIGVTLVGCTFFTLNNFSDHCGQVKFVVFVVATRKRLSLFFTAGSKKRKKQYTLLKDAESWELSWYVLTIQNMIIGILLYTLNMDYIIYALDVIYSRGK